MSPTDLESYTSRIVAAALPQQRQRFGPWLGSMRSVAADMVPLEYLADTDTTPTVTASPSLDFLYLPRSGTWKRRLGQTIQFDTASAGVEVTGLLGTKWGAKGRQLEEFKGDVLTSNKVPTLLGLATKEVMASASVVDDGRYSTLYVRDQVVGANYTLGSEYSTTTYPDPGSVQNYKVIPLWYDSGDGGITRGAGVNTVSGTANSVIAQRFFVSGSRRVQQSGRWVYSPSLNGTPSRWSGEKAVVSSSVAPTSVVSNSGWGFNKDDGTASIYTGGGAWENFTIDDAYGGVCDDDISATRTIDLGLGSAVDPNKIYTVVLKIKRLFSIPVSGGVGTQLSVYMTDSAGVLRVSSTVLDLSTITDTATNYTFPIDGSTFSPTTANMLRLVFATSGSLVTAYTFVGLATITGAVANANRLIPSGPWPMTHSGTLTKGTNLTATSSYYAESDNTDGLWVNELGGVALTGSIDETTANDTDFIVTPAGTDTTSIFNTQNFASVPVAGDTVRVTYRAKRFVLGTGVDLNVIFAGAATTITTDQQTLSSGFAAYSFTLSDAQIAATTAANAAWDDIRIHFAATGSGGTDRVWVSHYVITHTPAGPDTGGWRGSDRYYYGAIPIFEDGSYFMPTLGRAPNALLPDGFNLFTVDENNPGDVFDKVTWNHLPQVPYGFQGLALVRSDKIDSTTEDDLALNPLSLRVVDIVPAGTTSYVDYKADDDALQLDPDRLLVRWDHIMPPRARYAFAGDMRMCHSYGALSPAAIIIAPVGHTADYDLNDASSVALTDTSSGLFGTPAMHMRIDHNITTSSVYTLNLVEGNETSTEAFPLTLGGSFDTLQKLVDGINAMSVARDGQQWRAQLCPGVSPDTLSTNLLPHARAIASCVVASNVVVVPSSIQVAVGQLVSGSGVTTGAYVSAIVSATTSSHTVNITGTITDGTKTLTFYFDLGDNSQAGLANEGYQRVIGNQLPGFLYFRKTFLDQYPVEKASVWMTTASPASTKSAPNCFSGQLTNKFFPPNESGIAMGGVGIDNGFFVPFSKRRAVIRNTRDSGTGLDQDYRLFVTNENSGCVSWMSVTGGTGFGVCASPEGIVAASLTNEMLLSEAIWRSASSEGNISSGSSGTGDFVYEIPQSIAATAADSELNGALVAYLACRIMRGVLYVNYRNAAAAVAHPNRQVQYDFSSGMDTAGLQALRRNGQQVWGWSVPLTRSMTAMAEGRRTDGSHIYGWKDTNAGSTGDGRIDEFETTELDNTVAISTAVITVPWFRPGSGLLSVQEFTFEHVTTTGVTSAFDFHRSLSDETYSFTPTTSASLPYIRDLKMATLPARAPTTACYIGVRQSAGTAMELRSIEMRYKAVPSYR